MLYPLKFKPILKEKIWGGQKLNSLLAKKGDANAKLGESWEISTVEGNVSVVENGHLKGQSLIQLIETYKHNLVGNENYNRFGLNFPLLIKFIDAHANLSIQVHPDDEMAKRIHNAFGKTEMWYIMQAEKNSNLVIGFNSEIDKADYILAVENNTIEDTLNTVAVSEGDAFLIEAGQIHAIGAGVLLAEIQQTSDLTYRIYDWNRTDDAGNSRELHTEKAAQAIKFNLKSPKRRIDTVEINTPSKLIYTPYFKTNSLVVKESYNFINTYNSFIIFMCVKGNAFFTFNKKEYKLNFGETLLMPSCIEQFTIQADWAELLEIYI